MFCVPVMSVPSVITEFLSSLSYFHKPELKHLAHYLTGLLTLMNKTCRGISSMVFDSRHPSSLSRFFSRGKWESEEVNSLRLSMEKSRLSDENPRFGTLIVDDVFVKKRGKKIPLSSYHYDPTDGTHKWGHKFVSSLLIHKRTKVAVSLKPYVRKEDCGRWNWEFKSKNELFKETVKEALRAELPLNCVVFDSWYLNRQNCDFLEENGLNWVSSLKKNAKVRWHGKMLRVDKWYERYGKKMKHKIVKTNPFNDREEEHRVLEKVMNVFFLGRKAKLVVEDGEGGEVKFYLTNRLEWDAGMVLTRYRYRWVIETYHRDLKQHLGLGECEMRTVEAVKHHISSVLMGATLLDRMVSESGLMEWVESQRSTAMGRKQRSLLTFVVRDFILWILRFVGAEEEKCEEIFSALHQHLRLEELERVIGGIELKGEEVKANVKERRTGGST